LSVDLFADTLRSETAWLGAVNVPVGTFSFLELVFLPYDPLGLGSTSYPVSGGVRGVFKLDAIRTTLELGYLGSGPYEEHRPYISLHGHLLVDWNLSASLAVPVFDPQWGQWDDWLDVSAGIFHLVNLGPSRTLSFRLEAAVRPGEPWAESPGTSDYALFLFPELVFAPNDTLSLQLRSFVSPVDGSALIMTGADWNVYQGLSLFSYATVMAGEWGEDTFSLDQEGAVSWTAGLEFIY
jgi:hypothetical protein